MRVYLFHPHPYALTLSLSTQTRVRGWDAPDVPALREGILLLDLHSLRLLVADENGARSEILPDPL